MKKLCVAIGILVLGTFATVSLAFGPGPGMGAGPGPGIEGLGPQGGGGAGFGARVASELNLTQQQRDELRALRKRQWQEVKPLREQMYQKRQEMRDLYTDPSASDTTIMAKQKELNALQQQMQDKMVQFRLEQRRILTPDQLSKLKDMPFGHGRGACGGHGRGWGAGRS